MAKSLLIISRQSPWSGPGAREALDIVLAGGARPDGHQAQHQHRSADTPQRFFDHVAYIGGGEHGIP